jgi:hypothetical protein
MFSKIHIHVEYYLWQNRKIRIVQVPSLLAYSVVLNKDPNEYQSYTPQHKIGTSMNKEAGSLIKLNKTGQEEGS